MERARERLGRRRPRSGGLRITKVGLWYLVMVLPVAAAAVNTGNNGLYLVLSTMVGSVVVGQLLASVNVRGLGVEVRTPDEIFANRPALVEVAVTNRSRLLPRWLLVLTVEPGDVETGVRGGAPRRSTAGLVPALGRGAREVVRLELLPRRRGRRRLRGLTVASLFPFGFFRKTMRHPAEADIVVYPEIFASSMSLPETSGRTGDEGSARRGWGHELLSLRDYRRGDDPRQIHWKQTARSGRMIFTEREAEESRRLSIVLDNALLEAGADDLQPDARRRFERLVSEAATAALDYLGRGYEVELRTRDLHLPYAPGRAQRHRVLEHLAVVEPVPRAADPLASEDATRLTLTLDLREIA